MVQDEIIAEVRRNREELGAQFDYDVAKLFRYFREKQEKRERDDARGDAVEEYVPAFNPP